MPSADLIKIRVGQTAMHARRVGESELLIEDLLALDPGDAIIVGDEEMLVVSTEANRHAPGPNGPAPQTRVVVRPVHTGAASVQP